ncbi:holo-[acyl-carrier-protein] synthase [Chytriomyces confervae]|uniref:Holo-[acyl-carrier-protein] synthase n=1 Tax=Chytriomyces confervae TaxID=246404 RepID=A0A507DVE2_9FUNG|nr:holo-[acyl-carrier-protein] synthase [Chytriomyces confervae]
MILGLGCDIVHLPRITALLSRTRAKDCALPLNAPVLVHQARVDHFASFIFGGTESSEMKAFQAAFGKRDESRERTQRLTRYLASRFAVKEACFKAMYLHYSLQWADVVISRSERGKPEVSLSKHITEKLGPISSHVSISHDGEYAMATVIFEK